MLALAKIKRSKAVLKTFWNHVRNVRFHEILSFHDGIAAVRDDSGAYHVDSNWKPAYAHRFDRTYGFYAGRRAAVESVGEAFHIDLQGNPVYSQRYDWCGNFHSIPEGFRAPVRANDEQYYYVDHTGTKKLGPFLYAGDPSSGGQCVVYDFTSNPLIINSDGSKWVDANKNWIDVCVPHKGIARVKDSAGWFYVDQTGREVGKGRYLEAEPHYNGQARVKLLNGQWVVIDEKGRTVKELGESVTASQAALEEASQAYWKSFAMKYTLENSTMDIAGDSSSVKNYILHEILRDTAFEMGFLGIDIKTGDLKVLQRGELLMSKTEDIGNRCKYWLQNRYMNAWMGANVPTDVTVPLKNLHLDTFADIANNKETVKLSHDVLKSYARDDWKEIADPLSRILPEDEKSRIRVVVDLGGGHGMLLKELEGSHILPAVEKYMCIDRSEVLAAIDKDISCDKIEYLVGDLFDGSNLCQGDLYLMSRVLHDWPDERVIDILQQVRYHSPDQARLIIIDREKSAENLHSLLSLHMYLLTGAHERTYDEWQHLFSVSGWKFDKREYHNGHAIYSVLKSELPMPKEPVHEGNNIPQVNADNTKASVRKAVITVGGLATRMLPQSKVTPKALLPIVSKADQGSGLQIKPALSHTLDQLQNDGRITDVCIVCNPNELELLKTFIAHCSNNLTVNIELKVQNSPRGFGDAVLTARDFVGNEPFLLVLGDHLFEANCITDVLNSFDNLSENYETGEIGISGACLCDNNEVSQTGLLRSNSNRLLKQSPWKVEEMLEKPESGYSSFELSQQYPGMFPAQLVIIITLSVSNQLTFINNIGHRYSSCVNFSST